MTATNELTTEQKVADAIRKVTAKVQDAIDRRLRASDLVEVLLSIADELDPE